jgi:uncharacterized protein UPF0164
MELNRERVKGKSLMENSPRRPASRRVAGDLAVLLAFSFFLFSSPSAYAASGSGTEGAAFLDIPVGGAPAALGSAYTALSNDAYAATYNPAGLGFLESTQFSGQHLSYLDTLHYEYLSFAVPIPRDSSCGSLDQCPGSALGGSVQYLGSGGITGRDGSGAPTGDFSSFYASYNLSYGHSFNEQLSLGLTGKMIQAKLDDVSAAAYAADLGAMYIVQPKLTLAMTVTNIGSKLKFLSEGDPLPLAVHLGAAYKPSSHWMITSEAVYPQTGLASFHIGGQWRPLDMLSLRAGYRTDTVKELSVLAGYSAGLGVEVWGQELAYAWLPYGDLGSTHYISLLMKFGEAERSKRNLIQYQHIKKHRTVKDTQAEEIAPDYQQLMELVNDTESHLARQRGGGRENQ